jgi:hypothetical protein
MSARTERVCQRISRGTIVGEGDARVLVSMYHRLLAIDGFLLQVTWAATSTG